MACENQNSFHRAAEQSQAFLMLYSPIKPPRFAAPGETVLQPERTIRQALGEAQFILNQTSIAVFTRRVGTLKKLRGKQRIINGLHLVTGSGFVILIAKFHPDLIAWAGAAVSLGSGILGLTLPENVQGIERQILDDTTAISSLSGQIARIQAQLLLKDAGADAKLSEEIVSVIGKCGELSKKYELDKIALESGFFPRSSETSKGETNLGGTAA